jgi:hypothetical protein
MANGVNGVTKTKLTWRDVLYVLTILISMGITIITFSNKYTLLQDQVTRNKVELEQHNLDLIEYKLQEVDHKIDRVLELLGE